jgi:hypothetical protein
MESNLVFKWINFKFFTKLAKIRKFKLQNIDHTIKLKVPLNNTNKTKGFFGNYEPNIGANIILIFIYQHYVIFTFGVRTFNGRGPN